MSNPIYLSNLTWPDVEVLLARDDRLLLVTGATEQHGRHLPLGTDNRIPLAIAERLSACTGIAIAPHISIGMSEAHMAFPGTFTFTDDTLKRVYLELIQSAYRQGWRRLFVINGHGGNCAAWRWAAPLAMKIKSDLRIDVHHWWQEPRLYSFVQQTIGRTEGHAGLEETAAMLAIQPAHVQLEEAKGHAHVSNEVWSRSPEEVRQALPLGAIGENPAEATSALGEQLLALLVDEYLAIIEGDWK